ncbi:pancreatic lipase-related protein 2-like isoform X2 [Rhodnius prolixus]
MNDPWVSLIRPFPSPYPPEDVDTGITLYTRNAPSGHNITLWPEISLEGSDFKPRRIATLFLTHGFASNGRVDWLLEMKDAYLEKDDVNVFVVDWENGSSICSYLQAASNTRIVGAELVRFGKHLTKKGLKPANTHLVGHSLGAHIMSYMAKGLKTPRQLGRLTALDPAQPGFEGADKAVRLNKDDAKFVDVIHTDAKPFIPFIGFGMMQPTGDVDFYMNGGSRQPGCMSIDVPNITSISDLAKIPVEAISKWVSCSHGRSYEYFTWALKLQNCSMWGRKMSSTENFLKVSTLGALVLAEPVIKALEECDDNSCSVLGLDTFKLKARGIFSVTTASDEPFCETTSEQSRKLKNLLTGALYSVVSSTFTRPQSVANETYNIFKDLFR